MSFNNLALISQCDGFPYADSDPTAYLARVHTYYQLRVAGHDYALGYMLPSVAEVFRGTPAWELDDDDRVLTLTAGDDADSRSAAVERAMLATGLVFAADTVARTRQDLDAHAAEWTELHVRTCEAHRAGGLNGVAPAGESVETDVEGGATRMGAAPPDAVPGLSSGHGDTGGAPAPGDAASLGTSESQPKVEGIRLPESDQPA